MQNLWGVGFRNSGPGFKICGVQAQGLGSQDIPPFAML